MSSKRSEYGSLSDRVGRTPRPLPCHVWVDGSPGLLLEWRRTPDGAWSGRCVISQDGQAVEVWMAARRISPSAPDAGVPNRQL